MGTDLLLPAAKEMSQATVRPPVPAVHTGPTLGSTPGQTLRDLQSQVGNQAVTQALQPASSAAVAASALLPPASAPAGGGVAAQATPTERAEALYAKLVKQQDAEIGGLKRKAVDAWKDSIDAAFDAVEAQADELATVIQGPDQAKRYGQVGLLLSAVRTDRAGTTLDENGYVKCLLAWNASFGLRQQRLSMPPITAKGAALIVDDLQAANLKPDSGFAAFRKVTDAPLRLFRMREIFVKAGLAPLDIYAAMQLLQDQKANVGLLCTANAEAIHHLARLAPPNKGLAGFPDWGPGNHQTVATNKDGHFLKHVLDAHPESALPWQGECADWWKTLQIALTRAHAESTFGDTLWSSVEAEFPAEPQGTLAFGHVEAVVSKVKAGGGWPEPLKAHLVRDYGHRYCALALELSKSMRHIIVHTDHQGVMVNVKGVNDRYFLGGRIHDAKLGLSTCFIPKPGEDLVKMNEKRRVWQVSP